MNFVTVRACEEEDPLNMFPRKRDRIKRMIAASYVSGACLLLSQDLETISR